MSRKSPAQAAKAVIADAFRETTPASEEYSRVAFQLTYSITQPGHTRDQREVIVAARTMGEAVGYVEGQGGVVLTALAVSNGAACITL